MTTRASSQSTARPDRLPAAPPPGTAGARRGWRRLAGCAAVVALGLGPGFAPPAAAGPILVIQATPLAGGLVAYDVAVDFRDGLARSGFVDVTFSGTFDAQSQLFGSNWPDLAESSTSSTRYHLRGGTGGGSSVDVLAVARLVVPQGQSVRYDGVVSRNGRSYTIAPEPTPRALALAGLLGVTGLSLRRREAAP